MTASAQASARPLLDLLGGRWRVGSAALAAAWDRGTGVAAFALADGTVALVHPVWDGGPAVRVRPVGGLEWVAGSSTAPPAARAKAHQGCCNAIAADPDGGFLTGGSDGRVTGVQVDGTTRTIRYFDGPVTLLAAGAGHWRACAVRDTVHRLGGSASSLTAPGPVAALALHPAGAELAIGHTEGVILWAGGDRPRERRLPSPVSHLGWSRDQDWLAAVTQDGRLHAWQRDGASGCGLAPVPPVAALAGLAGAAFAGLAGAAFAAGQGGRVMHWQPRAQEMRQLGVTNQAVVTRLAGHPRRPLVAAGYANGTVALFQPATTEFLLIRAPGDGAVSALAFSADGGCLAMGTEAGDIGALPVPDALFREHTRP